MCEFKVGQLVQEGCSGPVMRILQIIESGRKAVCQVVVGIGKIVVVAVACLVMAVVPPIEAAHGNRVDDNPAHVVVQHQPQVSSMGASGTTTTTPAPVARVMVVQPPEGLDAPAHRGSGYIWIGPRRA